MPPIATIHFRRCKIFFLFLLLIISVLHKSLCLGSLVINSPTVNNKTKGNCWWGWLTLYFSDYFLLAWDRTGQDRVVYCWCVKIPSDITYPNCLPCLCINGRKMIIYLLEIPTLPTTTGVKFYYLHLQFFTSKLSQAKPHIERTFTTNDSYFFLEIPCGNCKTKYISILRYLKDYLLS